MNSPASMKDALDNLHRGDFELFASSSCDDLIHNLAEVIGVPMALLDTAGRIIAGAPSPAGDEESAEAPPEGAITAAIEFEDVVLGTLVAYTDNSGLESMVRSLAEQLESRFGLEQEAVALTDRLSHSYDVTNLLQSYVKKLRPNRSLGWNARKLLAETSELLEERLLIQWLPEHECLGWNAGPGLELSNRMRYLTANQFAMDTLLDELALVPDANNMEATVRHRGSMMTPDGKLDYVLMPVRGPSEITGLAGLVKNEEDPSFETTEIRLLECLVDELTNTTTNRVLQFEIRTLLFNVMKSLVVALEAKDEYTHGHSERVYGLSIQLAEQLGLSEDDLQTLAWAALLHDIGKIGVDESILRKPDRLTAEEYDAIKRHPGIGASMLEPIEQLRIIVPGIRHHHERFDGKGYPDGLAGEEIPLVGRIIAVADTYDAVVSSRPYRPSRTAEQALEIIREGAGTQFDPEIAQVFLNLAAKGEIAPPAAVQEEPVSI